jgi:hypothetical protein
VITLRAQEMRAILQILAMIAAVIVLPSPPTLSSHPAPVPQAAFRASIGSSLDAARAAHVNR